MQKIQKGHWRRRDLRKAEWLGGFSRSDRLEPVITIVLYYGKEPWDGARDILHLIDCKDMPEEILRMVNNYKLHILEVRNYPQTGHFKSDIRDVFRFIQCSNDKAAMKALTESERTGARSKAETVAQNMFLRGMSAEDAAAVCEEDLEQVRAWFAMWKKR